MIDQQGSFPASLNSSNTRAVLERRARLFSNIRDYFASQGVLEVETPLLGDYPVTDPHLENLRVAPGRMREKKSWQYLQTSPEYAMKDLLSKGSGSIYQICKAFRDDPNGRLHLPEFTMLEWYRVGYTLEQLMDDVVAIVETCMGSSEVERMSYRTAFTRYAGIDPFSASLKELKASAAMSGDFSFDDDDRDTWLDVLLTHVVEPRLGEGMLTFLFDYPASQSALAMIENDESGAEVAKRFELYIDGIEIANGYKELIDVDELQARMMADNSRRAEQGKETKPEDRDLILSMDRGLPPCAGVALGLDRLLLSIT